MSVLKELLENSLDAGAGRIDVEIDGGGIDAIRVTDDGCGISADSLAGAFRRHWTSKIQSADDLTHIGSLGFRGEALASIAAVAEVSVVSRTSAAAHAWRCVLGPGQPAAAPMPASGNCGTRLEVRHLFAQLPARKRFLKQPRTEQLHVQRLFRQIVFAAPHTAFSLRLDGAARTDYPVASGYDDAPRWRQLLGHRFLAAATPVDMAVDDMLIRGWVGDPAAAPTSSEQQYLAINGRMVRDRQLAHAIRLAFAERIASGRYPAYALALTLPLDRIDVNVHPGKLEVRLLDLRRVHDVLASAVRHALGDSSASVALAQSPVPPVAAPAVIEPPAPYAAPRRAGATRAAATVALKPGAQMLALVAQRYLLVKLADGLVVVDVPAAWRMILQHRLHIDSAGQQRPLLIPVRLPPGREPKLSEQAALQTLGFELDALGTAGTLVRGVPRVLPQIEWDEFFAEWAQAKAPAALGEAAANDVFARVASTAAATLALPPTGLPDRAWLAHFEASLGAAGMSWRDAGVVLDSAALATLFNAAMRAADE